VTQETFPGSYKGDKNPKTGNTLIVRTDDTEDAIRKRIAWSISDTLPLLHIWEANGHKIHRIDADQSEEEIFAEVEKAMHI
jgi:adenylate kinase family enzyme